MWDGLWESMPSATRKANWVPSFLLIGLPGTPSAEEAFMRAFFTSVKQVKAIINKPTSSTPQEPTSRSRTCYTVDEVTGAVLERKAAPSVLVFVGHGMGGTSARGRTKAWARAAFRLCSTTL